MGVCISLFSDVLPAAMSCVVGWSTAVWTQHDVATWRHLVSVDVPVTQPSDDRVMCFLAWLQWQPSDDRMACVLAWLLRFSPIQQQNTCARYQQLQLLTSASLGAVHKKRAQNSGIFSPPSHVHICQPLSHLCTSTSYSHTSGLGLEACVLGPVRKSMDRSLAWGSSPWSWPCGSSAWTWPWTSSPWPWGSSP